jgi:predicted transposase YbfD/YdcC
VCHLLVIAAVVWLWLWRWVMGQMMSPGEEPLQACWWWTGWLPNSSAIMQVQLLVRVSPALAEEAVFTAQVKQGPAQVSLHELEFVVAPSSDQPPVVSLPVSPGLQPAREEALPDYLAEKQPWATGSRLIDPPASSVAGEQLGRQEAPDLSPQDRGVLRGETEPHRPLAAIPEHFSKLDDPRIERTKKHQLLDMVIIAICAVVSGADTWVEVAKFGQAKLAWLQSFLDLPNGIPAHDTFGRVFRLLDAEQFQGCFLSWVQAVGQVSGGQIVPIDGKTLRRSHDKSLAKKAIHMVSAWASENRLVLGQVKVAEKSHEITAIPALLERLTLSGCIVTIDAMGCQKEIATKIIAKEADYVLALKGNQPSLYEVLKAHFAQVQPTPFDKPDYHQTVDNDHGRLEIRHCWTSLAPKDLPNLSAWKGLQTIALVRAERRLGDQLTVEDRYYISSLTNDAEQILQAVRTHWRIENSLHWVLDIAFREDDCRIRKGNGAQNFALLRHIALNLLGQELTAKCGTQAKRKMAGWDEAYLLKVLNGFT